MTWEIILSDNQIQPTIYTTPASLTAMRGNIAALKIVTEGLRLQPCSPSFVQSRDAILQADQLLFGGRYRCAIGRAFARRGLGAYASTGSSSNDRFVTEDFTPIGGSTLSSPITLTACTGTVLAYTATSSTPGVAFSWTRALTTGISNASATASSATINETLVNTTNLPVTVQYKFFLSPDICGGVAPQIVNVLVNPAVLPTIGSYVVCQQAAIPLGEGLVVSTTTSNTVNGQLTTFSPTYVRGSGDNITVYIPDWKVYYQAFTFTVPVSGTQTFNIVAASLTDGYNDTYLSLYQTAFNPASPATNFLRGDDDSGPGLLSSLTHSLTQGTTYVLVVSTYDEGVTGGFTLQASTPVFSSGLPSWFAAPTGGLALATGTVFNPVGLTGAGIPNTATPGTTTFYVSRPDQAACRRATTFSVLTTAPPVASSTTITSGNSLTISATGCSGTGAVLKWYRTVDNVGVSMPISPTITTNYYARCERTNGTKVCLSDNSQNVVVTVIVPTSFDSVRSGNWNIPATWNCNCIPNTTLPVQIMDTHTVTVPNAYKGQAKEIHFIGTGKLNLEGSGGLNILR